MPDDVVHVLVKALLDLCISSGQNNGFQIASTVSIDTEDLLVDGAID